MALSCPNYSLLSFIYFPFSFFGIGYFPKDFLGCSFLLILSWPRGYETFSMLNSAEHDFFPTHKCSNANNCWVGILTFMSRKNRIIGLSEPEKTKFLDLFKLMSISNIILSSVEHEKRLQLRGQVVADCRFSILWLIIFTMPLFRQRLFQKAVFLPYVSFFCVACAGIYHRSSL